MDRIQAKGLNELWRVWRKRSVQDGLTLGARVLHKLHPQKDVRMEQLGNDIKPVLALGLGWGRDREKHKVPLQHL